MTPKIYPLAPSTWGAGLEIPVDYVSQAALFTDFAGMRGTTYVEVVLEANPLNGSWRVRRRTPGQVPGAVFGEIAPEWRAHFPAAERIHRSLFRPATLAAVKLDPDTGRFAVEVVLPQPQLAVPRNDVPEAAVVLPPGDMVIIDTSVGEFDAEGLSLHSPGQWFVGLQRVEGTVLATLGGQVLGAVEDAANEQFVEWVAQFGPGELWARAVLIDGMAALDAGAPEEGAGAVPALTVPDDLPLRPWQVIEFPGGGWAVTVARDSAVDPVDIIKPRHTARYVSLEGEARPEALGAPTEMFNRVTEPAPQRTLEAASTALTDRRDYLTEVEKVQLRRRNDVKRRGGRHRR